MTLFSENSTSYKWWLLANVMLGTFLAVLDTTVINVGLPVIMKTFAGDIGVTQWVVTGYMLSMVVMLPSAGFFAGRFGYKRLYLLGVVIFTLGSLLCSLAPSLGLLIASRIFQGFGCGIIQPLGMAIISKEFPPKQRGLAIGFWAVAVAASVSLGPFVGGYLIDNYNWHVIFDINVPLGVIAIVSTILIQREFKDSDTGKFDLLGFVLMFLWLPIALFAFSEASSPVNHDGWGSPRVWVSGLIALLLFVIFIMHSLRSRSPIVDVRLFGNRNFTIGVVVMFLFGVGLFGGNFLLPLYLQNVMGYSALSAGLVFLPVGIIQGTLAPLSGYFSRFTGNKILIMAGVILFASYFMLSGYFNERTPHWVIMLSVYMRGMGMGLSFTPLNAMILASIPTDKITQASGISNTVRQFAGSLGIALFTSILTIQIASHNAAFNSSADYNSLKASVKTYALKGVEPDNLVVAQHDEELRRASIDRQAYVSGVDDNFMVAAVLTLIAAVPLLFLRRNKNNVKI